MRDYDGRAQRTLTRSRAPRVIWLACFSVLFAWVGWLVKREDLGDQFPWLGIGAAIAVGTAGVAVIHTSVKARHRRRLARMGHCISCGYPKAEAHICPECGLDVGLKDYLDSGRAGTAISISALVLASVWSLPVVEHHTPSSGRMTAFEPFTGGRRNAETWTAEWRTFAVARIGTLTPFPGREDVRDGRVALVPGDHAAPIPEGRVLFEARVENGAWHLERDAGLRLAEALGVSRDDIRPDLDAFLAAVAPERSQMSAQPRWVLSGRGVQETAATGLAAVAIAVLYSSLTRGSKKDRIVPVSRTTPTR